MKKQPTLTPSQFKRLPKSERAVIIANDVVAQLAAQVYNPKSSYDTEFVKGFRKLDESKKSEIGKQDAATVLKEGMLPIKCEGCARASIFISAVKFKNSITVEEARSMDFQYGVKDRKKEGESMEDSATLFISAEFDEIQQALIESAFELSNYSNRLADYITNDNKFMEIQRQCDRAVNFGRVTVRNKWRKVRDNAREKGKKYPIFKNYLLSEICKNIVKNNGIFIP
jgi:hypothetical protein